MNVEVENTADGTPTLYRADLDEHYHSVKGAVAESRHVYVDLCWRKKATEVQSVRVFEVGFGSGLNAALTAKAAEESAVPTVYYAVELFPLIAEVVNHITALQDECYRGEFAAVNGAEWDRDVEINPFFTLRKIKADINCVELPQGIDAVYFDAFAPEKQPEMWSDVLFKRIYDVMSLGGVLTTYCAKGRIRRMLGEVGFVTERLPGPPAGKREVLRASKPI